MTYPQVIHSLVGFEVSWFSKMIYYLNMNDEKQRYFLVKWVNREGTIFKEWFLTAEHADRFANDLKEYGVKVIPNREANKTIDYEA